MVVSSHHPESIPAKPAHFYVLEKLQQYGEDTAMVDGITGKSYTYAQYCTLIQQIANGFSKLGLVRGDTVAIVSPNSVEFVAVLFGALMAGAVVTTCSPHFTKYELNYQLKDSNAKFIFTVPSHLAVVREACREHQPVIMICDGPKQPDCITFTSMLTADNQNLLKETEFDVNEDVALLLYSSGTTGLPKGVMLTHRNMIANLMQMCHSAMKPVFSTSKGRRGVVLNVLPLYHAYALFNGAMTALLEGTPFINLSKFEPRQYLSVIESYKVTFLLVVPPIVVILSQTSFVNQFDLSTLEIALSAAAPLSSDVEKQFAANMNESVKIKQCYGMTETVSVCVSHSEQRPIKPGSAGQLLTMLEGKVIEPATGKSLGPHQRGELCLRGPVVMKGYLNKPEATAATIDDHGFLHTGDIAYYDTEGYYFIVDRIKQMIKCKGFQVAPAELEAVLLTHPSVSDAGVTGVPHPLAGEVPKAFVTLKPGQSATQQEIKDYVAGRVAKYKHLEGGVVFVDKIPKSPSGKIQRNKLKNLDVKSRL